MVIMTRSCDYEKNLRHHVGAGNCIRGESKLLENYNRAMNENQRFLNDNIELLPFDIETKSAYCLRCADLLFFHLLRELGADNNVLPVPGKNLLSIINDRSQFDVHTDERVQAYIYYWDRTQGTYTQVCDCVTPWAQNMPIIM